MSRATQPRRFAAAIGVVTVSAFAAITGVGSAAAAPAHSTHIAPLTAKQITAKIDPALRNAHGMVKVVVQGGRSHESEIAKLGGHVTHDLSIIHGFSAKVPTSAVRTIAAMSGVTSVSEDRLTTVKSTVTPQTTSTNTVPSVYQHVIGSDSLVNAGDNGTGQVIALIDTGVTPMADVANSLVPVQTPTGTQSCINLSGTATCADQFGHGTFLAGLMTGSGVSSNGQYTGVAPGAKILSVKVGGADGSADVSTIIAALEVVVLTKNVYGTTIVNLSLGTNGTQSYHLDPLDYAVEQVWDAGIVVNVAASNLGPAAGTIDDPADDPFIITVGAINDNGTNTLADDTVAPFSSRGPTAADGLAKPDVTAPGVGLVSLAPPGATITEEYPTAMAAPYRQGSGTSMATAVVSGLEADLLSAEPGTSPARVKYQLMSTAKADASTDVMSVGAGLVNGPAALRAFPGVADVGLLPGLGTGSLQAARGTAQVQLNDSANTVLSGDLTAQLDPWNAAADLLSTNLWSSSWYSSSWYSSSWYSSSWYSSSWYSSSWYSSSWYSSSWYSSSWYSSSWYGDWS